MTDTEVNVILRTNKHEQTPSEQFRLKLALITTQHEQSLAMQETETKQDPTLTNQNMTRVASLYCYIYD